MASLNKNKDLLRMFEGATKKGLGKILYYVSEWYKHKGEITWYYYQFTNKILPLFLNIMKRERNGINILDENFDYLIILDACRYDVFSKVVVEEKLTGKLEKRISKGSSTVEFLIKNFSNKRCGDIIYITSNPYVSFLVRNCFYKVIDVWRTCWDDNLGTVPPDCMTDVALDVVNKYLDKRFIIHYLQPHPPYINHRIKEDTLNAVFKYGKEKVIEAYESNLKLVLREVKRLIKNLEGTIVITADHGEAFGEKIFIFPIYGHPTGIHIPVLVEVPWFIITKPIRTKHIKIHIKRKIRNAMKYIRINRNIKIVTKE